MNYTISQCLGINTVPQDVKAWLQSLADSKLPTVKDRVFTAQNQGALVTLLSQEYEKYNKAKAKRDAKKSKRLECYNVIKSLISAPQIISAEELLPRLIELKETIEQEKKFTKVDKALEATGMTRQQLIEYLQGK